MPFSVYVITSPSGKQYVGVSKNVASRWQSHVRRSRDLTLRHPFLDAIRKYGRDAFDVQTVSTFERLEDALAYEVFEIAVRRLNDRSRGYNVSRGGEYDCLDGPKKFWLEVKSDPERFERYLENCRAAGRKRAAAGEIDSTALVAYVKSRSAREAWKQRHRATRVAAKNPHRNGGPKVHCGNAEAVRSAYEARPPSVKKRHARTSRVNARALWERRTEDERSAVAAKISTSVKALHDDPEYRAKNLEAMAAARASVDRSVQGPAASKGLKKFWADLREDPARYAEYMARRTQSLLKTISKP